MSDHNLPLSYGEVSAFLASNGWRYLEALRQVRALFEEYRRTAEGRRHVYAIYSRGERQAGGSEFKQAWQIREKIALEQPNNPVFSTQDLHDIVGLTVVCIFPDSHASVLSRIAAWAAEGRTSVVYPAGFPDSPEGPAA